MVHACVKRLVILGIAIIAAPVHAHLADSVPSCRPFVRAEQCADLSQNQIVFDVDASGDHPSGKQILNVYIIKYNEQGKRVREYVDTGGPIYVSTGREMATFNEELDEEPATCGNTPETDRHGYLVSYDGDKEEPRYTIRDYVSKKFKAEMPYAIRVWGRGKKKEILEWDEKVQRHVKRTKQGNEYEGKGIFIHGIPKQKEEYLGTPASAGCVRVSTRNACRLYETIKTCGTARIRISGQWSPFRPVYEPAGGDFMKLKPLKKIYRNGRWQTLPRPTCEEALAASEDEHQNRIARFHEQQSGDTGINLSESIRSLNPFSWDSWR